MTHDELEQEIDRLRLALGNEQRSHADTSRILRAVRDGIMSIARDSPQRHAVELAFSLLAGAEGNDAAASAQAVATAFLALVVEKSVPACPV